jgi:hypothetical protein
VPTAERSPVVLDANVVIDLAKLDCLERVARLEGFVLLVVDEVVAEVKQPEQAAGGEQAAVAALSNPDVGLLVPVPPFPIPDKEKTHGLRPLQLDPRCCT